VVVRLNLLFELAVDLCRVGWSGHYCSFDAFRFQTSLRNQNRLANKSNDTPLSRLC
jgi:hypothetical protein